MSPYEKYLSKKPLVYSKLSEREFELLREWFNIRYWFCVNDDGMPLIFDYDDEPERFPGRGWIGKNSVANFEVSKYAIQDGLLASTNFQTEPVEVCFSPIEKRYYRFNIEFEKFRHKSLFPEQY